MFNIKVTGLDNLQNQIKEMAEKKAESIIRSKTDNLRCNEHLTPATLVFTGNSLNGRKYEVTGCCSAFIEEVKKAIK